MQEAPLVKRTSALKVLNPALTHVRAVLAFTLQHIVHRNWLSFLLVAMLGTLSRLLGLMSFVVALKGLLVTMRPETFVGVAQKALNSVGYSGTVAPGDVVTIVAGTLIVIGLLAYAASQARLWGISRLQRQFLDEALANKSALDSEQDTFMIERAAPAIDLVVSLLEVILFSCAVLAFVAFVSPTIIAFLIPILALMPLAATISGRHRLRLKEQERMAYKQYIKRFPQAGEAEAATEAWVKGPRWDYITARFNTKKQKVRGQALGRLMMVAAIVALIVYLSRSEVSSHDLHAISFPFIFILLGIRQLFNVAGEFGRNLSKLLDLRAGLHALRTPGAATRVRRIRDDDED